MKEKLLLYLFLTLGLMSMKAGDTTSITIKGYVKDATGKGIKGVVVNNGTNFTITDKKGAWTLPTDTLVSKFISISTPANTWPCWEASIKAEPRKAPTQGVQPRENTIPNKAAEKKPIFSVLTLRLFPRNRLILITPRKCRPKNTTIKPDTMLTAV